MNISDKAIGAAEEAWYEAANLEDAIAAAAPHIAAQALRDAATKILAHHQFPFEGDADFILALADEADNA